MWPNRRPPDLTCNFAEFPPRFFRATKIIHHTCVFSLRRGMAVTSKLPRVQSEFICLWKWTWYTFYIYIDDIELVCARVCRHCTRRIATNVNVCIVIIGCTLEDSLWANSVVCILTYGDIILHRCWLLVKYLTVMTSKVMWFRDDKTPRQKIM